MTRPADIPEWAWEKAQAAWKEANMRTLRHAEPYGPVPIARAILAAVEEERETVMDAAHTYLMEQYGYGMLNHPVDRGRIFAIRNRS